MPDDNYRNPSREAKHQQDLLKDNFSPIGTGGHDLTCVNQQPRRQKKLAFISSLQDYYSKNFHLSSNFQTKSNQQFPTSLKAISNQIKFPVGKRQPKLCKVSPIKVNIYKPLNKIIFLTN